jgi:hypothetical protein
VWEVDLSQTIRPVKFPPRGFVLEFVFLLGKPSQKLPHVLGEQFIPGGFVLYREHRVLVAQRIGGLPSPIVDVNPSGSK